MKGFSTASMGHAGMNAEAVKEAVLSNMAIGQQYRIQSLHEDMAVKCTLVDLSKKTAVFEHKNGTRESFTYSELWRQMMSGILQVGTPGRSPKETVNVQAEHTTAY